jgi:hypothetical protein
MHYNQEELFDLETAIVPFQSREASALDAAIEAAIEHADKKGVKGYTAAMFVIAAYRFSNVIAEVHSLLIDENRYPHLLALFGHVTLTTGEVSRFCHYLRK